jgi:CheY-like chemotaxis protein/HPt (histidine-containing phosphotransfer) domain-containing protein
VAIGMLRKLGLKADAVANGAEAVKALETIPYDIVLMDVQMPELDGLEATRQIRTSKSVRNPNIPIVAMTANAMQGDCKKCLDVGMNDYLSKPVNIKSLAEKLQKWLAAKPQTVSHHEAEKSCNVEAKKSIFDQAELLERMMGDSDMAQQILEVFLEDIPKQLESLKQALDACDVENFQRIVHGIKGAAANVSGESLRQLAADIEQACKEGRMESAADSYPKLYNEYKILKDAIKCGNQSC